MPALAPPPGVTSEIVRQAVHSLDATAGRLFVVEPGLDRLRVVASYGPEGAEQAAEKLTRRALALGTACQIAEGSRFERRPDPALVAAAVAPVGSSAALWVGAPPPRRFGDADLAELERLATIAAAALTPPPAPETPPSVSGAVAALSRLLGLRDAYAAADAEHVARLADETTGILGLDEAARAELWTAARLHDLGKIGVPDRILHKPGRLDAHERMVVQRHPVWGAEILAHVEGLETIAEIVRSHHERWDGAGYPAGLAGDAIPLASRIIAPCEAYRAMTSERPYRPSLPPRRALAAVRAAAGTHFDARVVDALLQAFSARDVTPEPNGVARPAGTPSVPGYGAQLNAAFGRLAALPALSEARDRLLDLLAAERPSAAEIVTVVESDLALTIALLRAANRDRGQPERIGSVPAAVDELTAEGIEPLVSGLAGVDFFERQPEWGAPLEQARLHAVAVQRIADGIARELGWTERDELLVAALLHDIGALALAGAVEGYPAAVHGEARTSDERVRAERHALGIDHAAIGAVLLRRWRFPARIVNAVESHHSSDAEGLGGILALADQLTHHLQGRVIEPTRLPGMAERLGLRREQLRSLMYELPCGRSTQQRHVERCPFTAKELDVMRLVAKGKQSKEIATQLGLRSSTVRSHLFKAYHRIGVSDRAQAVLYCTERGWL